MYDAMYSPLLPLTQRKSFGAGTWSVLLDTNRTLQNDTYVSDELRMINASAMHVATSRQHYTHRTAPASTARARARTIRSLIGDGSTPDGAT